ncbi:hypothetical protein LVO79_05465 [Roseivivax marinus]|uniref:hypothetical protein n=1 Tax=Roseivivax marinus TaxID=1379903 RepID=UPI001F03DF1D|nr:hypothetical protein [Roseivivax marinus]UMA65908.1 hypothetical protein LVO79_05465 [Roseivivax marinus]
MRRTLPLFPSLCVGTLVLAGACVQFPEIEAAESAYVPGAAYPDLVPIETLLASTPARATPEMRGAVESRADALRRRAAGLDGPVIDDATRARLDQGIQRDIGDP